MRMTTPDHTKWIVAICSKVFPNDQVGRSDIVQLQDPSTSELRQYIFVHNKDQSQIVEIQSLEADFSSFLVGRHVVKDGNLYVLNVVDPLFFVLQGCTQSTNQSTSWQPYDQTLDRLVPDKIVRDCVSQSQMGHLFQTLCTDQTDNVTFYKFAEAKALGWLQRKQERVYQCLLSQEKGRQQRRQALLARRHQGSSNTSNGNAGGSVSATFYIPDDPMAAPVERNNQIKGEISLTTLQKLRMESLQIVCNYLSEEWTDKFLNHIGVTCEQVFAQVQTKSGSSTTTVTPGAESTVLTTPAKVTPKPVRVEPARSIANKRLEKVNKRGMSSLTSFFGPPKKKLTNSKD